MTPVPTRRAPSQHEPLPRLPAGIPVLRRGDERVQIGLTGPDGLVLHGPADALLAFLQRLDGRHTEAALRRGSGLTATESSAVLRALDAAGVLARSTPAVTSRVKIIGLGVLGSAVARLLAIQRVALYLADDDPADPLVHPHARPGASRAEAVAAELTGFLGDRPGAGSTSSRPTVVGHWTKPDGVRPDLSLIVTDGPECDRIIPDSLMRDDQPHLMVRGLGDGVVIGPFVQPGRGPCLRCCDLTRRDHDPDWPTLLHQLSRTHGHPPAAIAQWGAATAAAQALAWLGGVRPETWGATLELRARDWTTRLRVWPVHPDCGCDWH